MSFHPLSFQHQTSSKSEETPDSERQWREIAITETSPVYHGCVHSSLSHKTLLNLCEQIHKATVLKSDTRTHVLSLNDFVIKRYLTPRRHPGKNSSRAYHAFNNQQSLLDAQISVAPTLAYLNSTTTPQSLLIMPKLDHIALEKAIFNQSINLDDVMKFVVKLHQAGICHGDLKRQNIIFWNSKLTLLDFDAVRIHPFLNWYWRGRDLGNLFSSIAGLFPDTNWQLEYARYAKALKLGALSRQLIYRLAERKAVQRYRRGSLCGDPFAWSGRCHPLPPKPSI